MTSGGGGRDKDRRDSGFALFFIVALCLGMVTVVLLYGESVSLEYRAASNAEAAVEAGQAIEGARRYLSHVLANAQQPGELPAEGTYQTRNVPIGTATYWVLGENTDDTRAKDPVYRFVDEASKLNLNTATLEMLEALPNMTAEFAAAIIDWRDADDDVTPGGAESANYLRLNPPYRCKNGPFESSDELRLVFGANLDLLYGEDTNQNNLLDPNEDDGDNSPPHDNHNGLLDRGLLNYVTVYSSEPNVDTNGNARVDINGQNTGRLQQLLEQALGSRGSSIIAALGPGRRRFGSVLEFYYASGMSQDEFALVQDQLTASPGNTVQGLINVNTASEEVLTCIPGIGVDGASQLVAQRRTLGADQLRSIGWVASVLDASKAALAGPYLTTRSYQFTADVVAVGHHGRGFRRAQFVFDTRGQTPVVIARHDLDRAGWPLGDQARTEMGTGVAQ